MLSVKVQFPQMPALAGMEKQVQFATVVALNRAAYAGAEATKDEMRKVFNSPTSWVLGGVRYVKARKDRLYSQVDFDFWGNKQQVTVEQVMKAEVYGGQRAAKRFESALRYAGVLPAGQYVVPGEAAKLDANGNMQAGQIVQIIAWFKGFQEQGYKANMTDKTKRRLGKDNKRTGAKGFQYVLIRRGNRSGLHPGIYQKFTFALGSSLKPVMIFVASANYRKRLDFYGIAAKAAGQELERAFPVALDEAIRTARPGPS